MTPPVRHTGTGRRWRIRAGATSDIADVLRLWQQAETVQTVTDNADGLLRLLSVDPEALLVAESHGEIVGSLIAAWNGWRGSFYRLAVRPDFRRRGLASALVRLGQDSLRQRGALRIDAFVVADELAAVGFWHAVGYTRQHRRYRFVRSFSENGC